MKTIKTLAQLADFINSKEIYPAEQASYIIARNGWHDNQHEVWGVANDGHEKIVINELGDAEVQPM